MPGVCPAVLQKTTKYTIRTSDQPTPAIAPTSHSGRSVPIMEAMSPIIAPAEQEDEMREHQVDRERDAARREAAVAAGLLAPANRERVVGPLRARAHGLRDLAGERRRLVHQRVAHLRARKHALQGPAEGLALHEAVGELLRLRALERIRDHPLQRGALQHPAGKLAELLLVERRSRLRGLRGDCLRDDALDDAVLDDRASDRLRAAGRP